MSLIRKVAKRILGGSLEHLRERVPISEYKRKLAKDKDLNQFYEASLPQITSHRPDFEQALRENDVYHYSIQIYEILKCLKSCIGKISPDALILDVGASDGFFLKQVHPSGIGLNLLTSCVERIRDDGCRSVQANIENLPYDDEVFDYVLCFETLEHVPNPIASLRELKRICKNKVYISIPWISKTRIHPPKRLGGVANSHIFEFDEIDFRSIISHVGLEVGYYHKVRILDDIYMASKLWMDKFYFYPQGGYFNAFQFYELTK